MKIGLVGFPGSGKTTVFNALTGLLAETGYGATRGLDRTVLSAMREVDPLCQVVRAFVDVEGTAPAPLREIHDLEAETILADLELVEKRVERLKKEKGKPREEAALAQLKAHLDTDKPLRELPLTEDEWAIFSGFRFLSQKPLLLVLNVDEDS